MRRTLNTRRREMVNGSKFPQRKRQRVVRREAEREVFECLLGVAWRGARKDKRIPLRVSELIKCCFKFAQHLLSFPRIFPGYRKTNGCANNGRCDLFFNLLNMSLVFFDLSNLC